MLKHEFENLIGREATDEEYTRANGLYMSTMLDKSDFCKEWESLKESMVVKDLISQNDYYKSKMYDANFAKAAAAKQILEIMDSGQPGELDTILGQLMDRKDIIRHRIENNVALTQLDKEYIHENLT